MANGGRTVKRIAWDLQEAWRLIAAEKLHAALEQESQVKSKQSKRI